MTSHISRVAVFLFIFSSAAGTSENGEVSGNFQLTWAHPLSETEGEQDEHMKQKLKEQEAPEDLRSLLFTEAGELRTYFFIFFHFGRKKKIHLCIKLPQIFLTGSCL